MHLEVRGILDDLAGETAWIGHRWPAQIDAAGKAAKPVEARRAEAQGSAMLALLVGHELPRLVAAAPEAISFTWLLRRLTDALLTAEAGLRPMPGYDRGEHTADSFHGRVGNRLLRINDEFRTGLRQHPGAQYDRDSSESVRAWGQAWSRRSRRAKARKALRYREVTPELATMGRLE